MQCRQQQSQCFHPACMLSRISHPATLWECSIKHNLWKKAFCNCQQQTGSARNTLTSLFSWPFSITDLPPHEPSCVPCETNPNKFFSRLHNSSSSGDKKESSWSSGLCLFIVVEENTVSSTSFSAAFLPFAYLHIPQSSPCSLSWCTLLFCCWWWGWTQVLTFLGMIHKLLDDKIATFAILCWFHKEEVK